MAIMKWWSLFRVYLKVPFSMVPSQYLFLGKLKWVKACLRVLDSACNLSRTDGVQGLSSPSSESNALSATSFEGSFAIIISSSPAPKCGTSASLKTKGSSDLGTRKIIRPSHRLVLKRFSPWWTGQWNWSFNWQVPRRAAAAYWCQHGNCYWLRDYWNIFLNPISVDFGWFRHMVDNVLHSISFYQIRQLIWKPCERSLMFIHLNSYGKSMWTIL